MNKAFLYVAKVISLALRCFEIKTEEARNIEPRLWALRGETSSPHDDFPSDFPEPNTLHAAIVPTI